MKKLCRIPLFFLASAAILAPLLGFAPTANAFEADGHAAIEREAYARLKARPASQGLPDGLSILHKLYEANVLKEDVADLVVHTTYPDISFERQFAQDRQVYHFMAPNRPVVQAAKLKIGNQPASLEQRQQKLLQGVLPDCFRMMYYFFRETIRNSQGASQAGRGIYVLMHVVGDSYSPEHATRTPDLNGLVAVKGWRLSRFGWPQGAKEFEPARDNCSGRTMAMLHRVAQAKADKCWRGTEGVTQALSPLANAAAIALEELLVTTYRAQLIANANAPAIDDLWRSYAQAYFQPQGCTVQGNDFVYATGTLGDGKSETIPFVFGAAYTYTPHVPKPGQSKAGEWAQSLNAFTFDRFPMNSWYVVAASGHAFGRDAWGWGVEMNHHWTPAGADERGVFWRRIPHGYALTASAQPGYAQRHLTADGKALALGRAIQVEGLYAPNVLVVPMLNATLQGRIGVGVMPLVSQPEWAVVSGASLAWNVGEDFGRRFLYSWRLALGYDYDTSALPAYHTVSLKLGFNSWKGRVIKNPLKRYNEVLPDK
ncbi:hypothetical protein Q5H92_16570 [Hymenobacter sp. M29]|uniref:Uncharacterized protein n=1 Tax=Hymenobacter mellowenesis TaxID=3063995 RepID=A0ABT9ADR6_9BACT|nr:hypothetical protein [Hymenobacter sp. M29]MDO7847981.1 hypothetical protein [Hymenobacter sp. M29]